MLIAVALEAKDVWVKVEDKTVLQGVSLKVEPGEITVLMGPNGSGKSSLAYTIMGHPEYSVEKGAIMLDGEDITGLEPYERSLRGVMLAFQNPVEVPGVKLSTLLIAAHNKRRGAKDLFRVSDPRLVLRARQWAEKLGMDPSLLYREVNVGFSGGEKKRAEMLQLLMLEPKYAILDEPDSGLDVDGIKSVARAIQVLVDRGTGVLLITHYARVLDYVEPSRVLVLVNGRIVAEGGMEIVREIDRSGYAQFLSKIGVVKQG